MAIFPNIWRPKPGRFGTTPEFSGTLVGNNGVALVASNTVTVLVPLPRRRCYIESITLNGMQAAVGGGAITARVVKRVSGAGSDTNITGATSLTSSVITGANLSVAVAITGTVKERVVNVGDIVKIDLVCASTITTQPTAAIVVEFSVID